MLEPDDAAVAAARSKVSIGRRAMRRSVNEQARLARSQADQMKVFCECGRPLCGERVTVTTSEYDAVRQAAGRFLVRPAHLHQDDTRVVELSELVIVESPTSLPLGQVFDRNAARLSSTRGRPT